MYLVLNILNKEINQLGYIVVTEMWVILHIVPNGKQSGFFPTKSLQIT
jgi:hypothetical protein